MNEHASPDINDSASCLQDFAATVSSGAGVCVCVLVGEVVCVSGGGAPG